MIEVSVVFKEQNKDVVLDVDDAKVKDGVLFCVKDKILVMYAEMHNVLYFTVNKKVEKQENK